MEQQGDIKPTLQSSPTPIHLNPRRPVARAQPMLTEISPKIDYNNFRAKKQYRNKTPLAVSRLKNSADFRNTAQSFSPDITPSTVNLPSDILKQKDEIIEEIKHKRVQTSNFNVRAREKSPELPSRSSEGFFPKDQASKLTKHEGTKSTQLIRTEPLKLNKTSYSRKLLGVFSSKMFPITDARGKLNLKFFLKPSVNSPTSNLSENKIPQAADTSTDFRKQGHSKDNSIYTKLFLKDIRNKNAEKTTVLNSESSFTNLNIDAPRQLESRSKESMNLSSRKFKTLSIADYSGSPLRSVTRSGPRFPVQVEVKNNTGNSQERRIVEEESEDKEGHLGNLLNITSKKKSDWIQRERDRQERIHLKLERLRYGHLYVPKRLHFLNPDESNNHSRSNNYSSTNVTMFAQTQVTSTKHGDMKNTTTENEMQGLTKWDSEQIDPYTEKVSSANMRKISQENYPVATTATEHYQRERESRMEVRSPSKEEKDRKILYSRKIQDYKTFMMGMNFSFNVVIKQDWQRITVVYKYYIGKGNNHELIQSLMRQRWWWSQTDSKDSPDLNFMWTEYRNDRFISSLKNRRKLARNRTPSQAQMTSSHESYAALSKKNSVTLTNIDKEQKNYENVFGLTGEENSVVKPKKFLLNNLAIENQHAKNKSAQPAPQTQPVHSTLYHPNNSQKLFTQKEIVLMENYISTKIKKELTYDDWEELCKMRKKPLMQTISDPSATRMCNHLEHNFNMANHKFLLFNLKNYYKAIEKNVFEYTPMTFYIKSGLEDQEFQYFEEEFEKRQKEIQKSGNKKGKNVWILRPGDTLNQEFGIHLCDDLVEMKEVIALADLTGDSEREQVYVIQKYIDRQLQYNKRNFHIKCFVMFSSINNCLKGYWYQEGFLKISKDAPSQGNKFKNNHGPMANAVTDRSVEETLTFGEFQKYLEQHYGGRSSFQNQIYPQLRSLAVDAVRSVYGKIDPYRREKCFEIFGFNYIVDGDFKAWLIDVDANPDFNTDTPVLSKFIPSMLGNVLRLTVDQMFPPPVVLNIKRSAFPENLLEMNRFELIFDEIEEGADLERILKNESSETASFVFV